MELEYTHVTSQKEMNQVFDLCAKTIGANYYEAYRLFGAIQRYDVSTKPQHWRIAKRRDGLIVAHVGVTLRDIRIGKATLSIGGIRNVTTHPDFIKDRPADHLVQDVIDYLRQGKTDAVMAYSLDDAYDNAYEDFGFIGVLPEYDFSIPAKEAEHVKRNLKFMSFDLKDVKKLNEIYLTTCANVPAHIVRDETIFLGNLKRNQILENTRKYTVHTFGEDNVIHAYLIMMGDAVLEACARDETGWETLISYLCDRATANRRENVDLSGLSHSHPMIKYCRRYRHRAATYLSLHGGGMVKLLGLHRSLEKMLPEFKARWEKTGFHNTGFLCVNFHVGKEKLSLVYDNGDVRLEMPSLKPTLTITVDEKGFAQMLFGTLAIDEIKEITLEGTEFLAYILFPKDYPQIAWMDKF